MFAVLFLLRNADTFAVNFINSARENPALESGDESAVHRDCAVKQSPQLVLYSLSNTTGSVPTVPISLRKPPVRLFETLTRALWQEVCRVKVKTLK